MQRVVDPETGAITYEGYCIDLMKEIKKKMPCKFEYKIYEARDGLYGTINNNDEWNGMIGDLVSGVHPPPHTPIYLSIHLSRRPTSPSVHFR